MLVSRGLSLTLAAAEMGLVAGGTLIETVTLKLVLLIGREYSRALFGGGASSNTQAGHAPISSTRFRLLPLPLDPVVLDPSAAG